MKTRGANDQDRRRMGVLQAAAIAGLLAALLTLVAIFLFRAPAAPHSPDVIAAAPAKSIRQRVTGSLRRSANLPKRLREEPDPVLEQLEGPEADETLLEIDGDTKFQRRLMLGEALVKIKNRAWMDLVSDEELKELLSWKNGLMVHDLFHFAQWKSQSRTSGEDPDDRGSSYRDLIESMLYPRRNRWAFRELYRSRFEKLCRRFESALVIDLDPGRSDALLLAHALASLSGFPGGVTIWNPGAAAD